MSNKLRYNEAYLYLDSAFAKERSEFAGFVAGSDLAVPSRRPKPLKELYKEWTAAMCLPPPTASQIIGEVFDTSAGLSLEDKLYKAISVLQAVGLLKDLMPDA